MQQLVFILCWIALICRNQILRPSAAIQADMIVNGLTDILMKAAEGDKVIFCYPGRADCFEATASYGMDGITEKVG